MTWRAAHPLDLAGVRALLADQQDWSPFDCVPGISLAGDRRVYAEQITRVLPASDDLRFVYQGNAASRCAVLLERLPWDSGFFAYEVARLHGVVPLERDGDHRDMEICSALQAALQHARGRGVTYLFAIVDARELALIRALGECGFALIENRLWLRRRLSDYAYPNRYAARLAKPADVPGLAKAARDAVNPYDRFHADPFIGAEAAGRLLHQWAHAAVLERFDDATFVPDGPDPRAFITIRYLQKNWSLWGLKIAQIGLIVCSPTTAGWGTKLHSEVLYHLKEQGIDYVICPTQINNRAMLRIGEKLGYSPAKSELVFRVVLQETGRLNGPSA